ncbi:AAA family ATPase [Acinetobacter baumannii]|nr:AAA family ATPase [Acinetobacter baumannii]MDV7600389.1 AAA family ATPase [Acinetobacter baumannii]
MSFIIEKIKLNERDLLLSKNTFRSGNIFTLLTGKNGVGKTRLLTSLVYYFSYIENSPENKPPEDFKILNSDTLAQLSYSIKPERIIVHTNSKHNKFPTKYSRDFSRSKNYYDLTNNNYFSSYSYYEESFFAKIILDNNINMKAISDTLAYLSYLPFLNIQFKLDWISFPAGYFEKAIELFKELLEDLNFNTKMTLKEASRTDKYFLSALLHVAERRNKTLSFNEIKMIYQAFNNFDIIDGPMMVNVDLKANKFRYTNINKNLIKIFLKSHLVRIVRVWLLKDSDDKSIFSSNHYVDFDDLSSGQQAIITTLLGISGVISDNSLICIDEPEISLHPEWQSEIINQLQTVFQEIQGCHFIIATHSPQVVSSLKSENGFIVNLEKMETYNACEHNHKSADYQLAKIFDTPGYNNEYLIRIGLVILSKISKRENLNIEDFENIKLLKEVKDSISKEDAVYFLIEQILSLVE